MNSHGHSKKKKSFLIFYVHRKKCEDHKCAVLRFYKLNTPLSPVPRSRNRTFPVHLSHRGEFASVNYLNHNHLRLLSLFRLTSPLSHFCWMALQWLFRHFWDLAGGSWLEDIFSWVLTGYVYVTQFSYTGKILLTQKCTLIGKLLFLSLKVDLFDTQSGISFSYVFKTFTQKGEYQSCLGVVLFYVNYEE